MVTVEADQVGVESRLAAGRVDCPDCRGPLRPRGVGASTAGAWDRRGAASAAGPLSPVWDHARAVAGHAAAPAGVRG